MEVFDQARFLISENESARIQRGEFSGRWYPETYEYMGVWYFVKLGLSLFLNTLIFGRSLYMLWIVRKIKSDTKSRVDVQDICLIFNILACFSKLFCFKVQRLHAKLHAFSFFFWKQFYRVFVLGKVNLFNFHAVRMISMLDPAKADYTKPFGDIFSTVFAPSFLKVVMCECVCLKRTKIQGCVGC